MGGTASVSTNVENELRSLGIQTIERISGNNRYEVSANIAERVVQNNPEGDTAIVVSGLTFPDGLSATSVAARGEMPLLLTDDNTLPSAIQTFLNNHPKIRNFIIIGGPATVSDTVATALDSYGDVERISGSNRYQVNVNVAEYFQLDPSTYVVTRGDDFPDALSGSVLAAATESPVLLTDPTTLPDPIRWHLEAHKQNLDAFYILGGTLSVSSSVEQELYNMIP